MGIILGIIFFLQHPFRDNNAEKFASLVYLQSEHEEKRVRRDNLMLVFLMCVFSFVKKLQLQFTKA